jgi:hypothetical protein
MARTEKMMRIIRMASKPPKKPPPQMDGIWKVSSLKLKSEREIRWNLIKSGHG